MNKNRNNAGSQSEIPHMSHDKNKTSIDGYQKFVIENKKVKYSSKIKKYDNIKRILKRHKHDCNSICDVGCSNGLVLFIAAEEGYNKIVGLDHDTDCVSLINKTIKHQDYNNVFAKKYNFGDDIQESYDIICMFALIHWIYSCTAMYGNFGDILNFISKHVNKYLLIEWIDPKDEAIKSFKHTSFNRDNLKQNYTYQNFIEAVKLHFGEPVDIYDTESNTRKILLLSHPNNRSLSDVK